MNIDQFIKRMTAGSKWRMRCECHGKSSFGMRTGDSYEEFITVIKVRRVRRQWEEPGKEVVLEVRSNAIPDKGYANILTSELANANIEEHAGFIRIVYDNDKSVTRDYYPCSLDMEGGHR